MVILKTQHNTNKMNTQNNTDTNTEQDINRNWFQNKPIETINYVDTFLFVKKNTEQQPYTFKTIKEFYVFDKVGYNNYFDIYTAKGDLKEEFNSIAQKVFGFSNVISCITLGIKKDTATATEQQNTTQHKHYEVKAQEYFLDYLIQELKFLKEIKNKDFVFSELQNLSYRFKEFLEQYQTEQEQILKEDIARNKRIEQILNNKNYTEDFDM